MIEWVIITVLWALGFYTNAEEFVDSFGYLDWPAPVSLALCLFWPLFAVVGVLVWVFNFVEGKMAK